ncbi:MAG: zinc-ribbon domain-containing protein [Acidaminococcaceae bacterium]|nr:zinc-ribbon domain-containing protein [Acidaminococcaceae bacterium]
MTGPKISGAIDQVRFCSNCGTKIKPGSKFCANCGTKV